MINSPMYEKSVEENPSTDSYSTASIESETVLCHRRHLAARLGTATTDLGAGQHLLIAIGHLLTFLGAAHTGFGTDSTDAGMQRRVHEHEICACLTNFSALHQRRNVLL